MKRLNGEGTIFRSRSHDGVEEWVARIPNRNYPGEPGSKPFHQKKSVDEAVVRTWFVQMTVSPERSDTRSARLRHHI